MIDSIQFGSREIEFDLVFVDRKSLGITVTPDSKVLVKAPLESPIEKIKAKLIKKAPWIIKQQSYFLSFQPRVTEKRYISGETHFYLGRQYQLKVLNKEGDSVKLKGQFIEVSTTEVSKVKVLLKSWYLIHAKEKFERIAIPLIEKFKKHKVVPQSIVLREMPLRWGSCTPKGKIILNPELIKAPKGCIEYVIVHELCHLIHHDHTPRFFELQSRVMPDWEKWKEKLERMMA